MLTMTVATMARAMITTPRAISTPIADGVVKETAKKINKGCNVT